ncbi:MAG: hypothetical protein V2J26_10610 [Pacificimonas sp.]|nr:hypothetical protein [Pacificimonas sp.]
MAQSFSNASSDHGQLSHRRITTNQSQAIATMMLILIIGAVFTAVISLIWTVLSILPSILGPLFAPLMGGGSPL